MGIEDAPKNDSGSPERLEGVYNKEIADGFATRRSELIQQKQNVEAIGAKGKPQAVALEVKIKFLEDEEARARSVADYAQNPEDFQKRKQKMEEVAEEVRGTTALAQVEEVLEHFRGLLEGEEDGKKREAIHSVVSKLTNIHTFNGFSSMGELIDLVDLPQINYEDAALYAKNKVANEIIRIKEKPQDQITVTEDAYLRRYDRYYHAEDMLNTDLQMPYVDQDQILVRDLIGTEESVQRSLDSQEASFTERQEALTAELTKIRAVLNLITQRQEMIVQMFDKGGAPVTEERLTEIVTKYDELKQSLLEYKNVVGGLLVQGGKN